MPPSVDDVGPRHFTHRAPASLEEAVKLADGGAARPLYLHLVVAPWGRNNALAHDVVAVVVQRPTLYPGPVGAMPGTAEGGNEAAPDTSLLIASWPGPTTGGAGQG